MTLLTEFLSFNSVASLPCIFTSVKSQTWNFSTSSDPLQHRTESSHEVGERTTLTHTPNNSCCNLWSYLWVQRTYICPIPFARLARIISDNSLMNHYQVCLHGWVSCKTWLRQDHLSWGSISHISNFSLSAGVPGKLNWQTMPWLTSYMQKYE